MWIYIYIPGTWYVLWSGVSELMRVILLYRLKSSRDKNEGSYRSGKGGEEPAMM